MTSAEEVGAATRSAVAGYTLGLGDDCLILSHRLSEWAAHAPEFEEDVALSNLSLDLLGQARSLLTCAGGQGPDGGRPGLLAGRPPVPQPPAGGTAER